MSSRAAYRDPTRRGFRWPSSEKKPREVSDATLNHLQPPSVHNVRVQPVRFVELVARYKTVQVRSQNSNPQNQEVVQGTPRWRLTFARIALLAGGRVQDDADDGADCGGAQRVAGACTELIQGNIPTHQALIISGVGAGALSQGSAVSLVAISSRDLVSSCHQSWAE